jgi:hypothetical protein
MNKRNDIMCHFSSTVDLQSANLYVHYRSSSPDDDISHPSYITKILFECNIKEKEAIDTWRRYMKRIYHWAMGPRLAAIKAAIQCLSDLSPGVHGFARPDDTQSTVSGSNATSSVVTVAHELLNERRTARASLGVFTDLPVLTPSFTPPLSDTANEEKEARTAKRKR